GEGPVGAVEVAADAEGARPMNTRIACQARAQAVATRHRRSGRGGATGEVKRPCGAVGGGVAALLAEQLDKARGMKLGSQARQVQLAGLRAGPEPLPQRRCLPAGSEEPRGRR